MPENVITIGKGYMWRSERKHVNRSPAFPFYFLDGPTETVIIPQGEKESVTLTRYTTTWIVRNVDVNAVSLYDQGKRFER